MIATKDPRSGLDRFCGIEDLREWLNAPVLIGGTVYRSNGHILVCAPPEAGREYATNEWGVKREPDKLMAQWRDGEFAPLPKLPHPQTCLFCKGAGFLPMSKCTDCKGEGTFRHGWHEYDCKECDGDGRVRDDDNGTLSACHGCGGLGHERSSFKVNDVSFDLVYLHWIAALPNPLVAVRGKADPLTFRFDGGDGLLMPRHE